MPLLSGRLLLAFMVFLIYTKTQASKSIRLSDKGLNCAGSLQCFSHGYLAQIIDTAAGISDAAIYYPGIKIACQAESGSLKAGKGFCSFMQVDSRLEEGRITLTDGTNVIGINGSLAKQKLSQLHVKCGTCGSVPIADSDDPHEAGILTVNAVYDGANCGDSDNPKRKGICPPSIDPSDSRNPYRSKTTVQSS